MVAAFSASYSYNDLIALGIFSIIGILMKRYAWPRPPLLVAVVLGPQLQNYLWLTLERYDSGEWLARPGVMIIGLVIVATIASPIIKHYRRKGEEAHFDTRAEGPPPKPIGDLLMVLAYIALAAAAAMAAEEWPPKAAVPVYVFTGFGALLGLIQLGLDVARIRHTGVAAALTDEDRRRTRNYREIFLWIAALSLVIVLFGFATAFMLFPLAYARCYGASWKLAIMLSIIALMILFGLFDTVIHIVWPEPLIFEPFQPVFDRF